MSDNPTVPSWSNPVWHRGWRIYHSHSHFQDVAFTHDDYDGDGSDDAKDTRHGSARTVAKAKAKIDAWHKANERNSRVSDLLRAVLNFGVGTRK